MKNVFISVPMRSRTKEDIEFSIRKMKRIARAYLSADDSEELNFMNTIVQSKAPEEADERVWFLGAAIQILSKADYLIAIRESYDYVGCDIEKQVFCRYKGAHNVIEIPIGLILTEREAHARVVDSSCTCRVAREED